MSLFRSLVPSRSNSSVVQHRADEVISLDQWAGYFSLSNGFFPFTYGTPGEPQEEIQQTFVALIQQAYESNAVVFACELARIMLFSEARFQWRRRESGRPGELFGTPELAILENPMTGRTTGDMLTRALQHADFGGTGFVVRRRDQLKQPRPDWMTIVMGSYDEPEVTSDDLDAEVIGYVYHPGGRYSDQRPVTLLPDEVATFAPIPDPLAKVRGIPWILPVIREVMADKAATDHKLRFFENGATPQMVVSFDNVSDPKKIREWIEVIDQDHKGLTNAYKTLYLGAGAKPTVVGKDLQQLDFKITQGAGETRIAAAANCGPVVAMLSEGLQGSSLNAGNFGQAMRRFADIFARPNWRNFAGSIQHLLEVPSGAELWYDDRDIPALKDDIKDAAEVQALQSTAIRTLSDGGFEPDSVVAALIAGDWKRLKHSGKLSVQLQEPGSVAGQEAVAAMAAPSMPLLASSGAPVEVRCSGTKRDGSECRALLGKRAGEAPVGFETKCHQCGSVVAA